MPPSHSGHQFNYQGGISCCIIEKQVRSPGEKFRLQEEFNCLKSSFYTSAKFQAGPQRMRNVAKNHFLLDQMQSWPINCQKMLQTQFPKKCFQPQESFVSPFLSSECLILCHFSATCSACLCKVSEIAGTDNIYRQLCGYYICKSVSHSPQAKNLMQARKSRGVDYINSVIIQFLF